MSHVAGDVSTFLKGICVPPLNQDTSIHFLICIISHCQLSMVSACLEIGVWIILIHLIFG